MVQLLVAIIYMIHTANVKKCQISVAKQFCSNC